MSEFTEGDRVREKSSNKEGEVTKVMEDDGGEKVRIEWDEGTIDQGVRRPHEVEQA